MDWRTVLLEEVGRAEREALDEVDGVVQQQAQLVRQRVDAERHRLRQALVDRARVVSDAGAIAAARALVLGAEVARRALADGDRTRAMAAHLAAQRAHDRLREAADLLADAVRASEGELSGPIVRASRAALTDGLPSVRRIVAEAAHRTALDVRSELELRATPPRDGIAAWQRSLAGTVRQARETSGEQGAAAIRAATAEVDRAIEAVVRATAPLPDAIAAAAEAGLPPALDASVAGAAPARPGVVRRVAQVVGASMAVGVVVGLGLLATAAGVAVAAVAFGAMAMWGSFAPPVTGGLLAGLVAVLLGALATDLLFGALADWREGIDDGLSGAIGPGPRPASVPGVDLRAVLEVLRLPDIVLAPLAADPGGVTDPGRYAGGVHTSTLGQRDDDKSEG